MKYEYTHFISENVAPKGATRIVIKDENGDEIAYISKERFWGLTPPEGDPLYRFGLVSDCHTYKSATVSDANWQGNKKLGNALAYFENMGCTFVVGCGDITQTGFYGKNESTAAITIGSNVIPTREETTVQVGESYYNETQMQNYHDIISESALTVFELFGNHENYGVAITAETTIDGVVYNSLARAKALIGIPATSYTVSSAEETEEVVGTTVRPNRYAPVGDDLYILCGQSNYGEVMSADDFTWLGNILEANKDRRCFVCIHSYMEGDSGDPESRRENSIFDTWSKTSAFVSLLGQYPNVILFHGHSHMKFEHQAVDSIANYATVKGYKSVHVPSLGKPRDIDPDASTSADTPEDFTSSQCYIVDVYADCIYLQGLEMHLTGVPTVEVLGTYKIET